MTLEQYQQLGFKAEGTELTPATLIASDYAISWHEIGGVKADNDINERRVRRASLAPLQPVGGAFLGRVSGTYEPIPSGTDGTAPGWFQLLAAAGATVTDDVAEFGKQDTAYAPIGAPVTFIHRDGQWARTAAGSRVETLTFKAEKGGLWLCEMAAVGRYSQAADSLFLASDLQAIAGKPFLGHDVVIDGAHPSVASIEISIENTIASVEDGTHASGYGQNRITEQRCMVKMVILDIGTDYNGRVRNDGAADAMVFSAQMSTGTAAGNTLTWTGFVSLMEDADPEFREGNGYVSLSGEFVATTTDAVLTLTQS